MGKRASKCLEKVWMKQRKIGIGKPFYNSGDGRIYYILMMNNETWNY